MEKLKIKRIFEIQLEIIINNNFYKKNIIDEYTYSKVNDKLLNSIKVLQNKGDIYEL